MRLSDCFIDLFVFVVDFLKTLSINQPQFESIKSDIHRLVAESGERFQETTFSKEDYDLARFAIFSWIDESILNSSWNEKDRWQMELLQQQYYKTTDADKIFFETLKILEPQQKDVREIYYLCLALGFMGRYRQENDRYQLDQLKKSNLQLLLGDSKETSALETDIFFPEAYSMETESVAPSKSGPRFSKFTLIGFAVPVLLFVGLFVIYTFILGHIGDSLF